MEKIKIEKLSTVLRICLYETFAIGLGLTVFLKYLLQTHFAYYFDGDILHLNTFFYVLTPSGIVALVILWQLIAIMETVGESNPFVYKNVKCLNTISVSCFAISMLFLFLTFRYPTILTFAICYIFLVAGLACLVFAKLFKKAVEYKRENDFTI